MDTKDAGRIGGSSTSEKKKAAARKNGSKGGRPITMFTATNNETGEVTQMKQSEVRKIILAELPHYPECWDLSDAKLKQLARENIRSLKSGNSPDISFGDYTFTK